ncbi:MAG: glycine cleavage system protein GcvH [Candidatus Bipolaricaulota bacterium]|nr:glycine cleavage system protein GcvH [Candidatus Bipolaricaulota bacterium]
MPYPKEYRYTKEHEWVKLEDSKARVGITDHAQHELGDIVYVELPKVGTKVKQMQEFATVESVKAVSPIYAPVSGEIVEINQELENKPELINQSPHEQGWIVVIALSNPKELESLMTAEQYERHIGT